MRIVYLLFFLITFSVSAQIELKIDSITSIDIDTIPSSRKFTLVYHVENLTNKEISFFLNPNNLVSNSRASMSRKIAYKIFQNEENLDIDNIFGNRKQDFFQERLKNAKTLEEKTSIIGAHLKEMEIDKSDIKKARENENFMKRKLSHTLLADIFIMKPKEKITFSKTLIWDKTRYFKIDDLEFYLAENTPHYFELSINLMKEQFKEKLSPEEFEKIMNNPNFIQGWFTSNKTEINFRE